jgi:hypothetical protein
MATSDDYKEWISTLSEAERSALTDAGITGPPEDAPILGAGRYPARDGDGLPHFLKNGYALPCIEDAPFFDETPDTINAELGEALRAVFVWILRGAEAPQLFKKPQRFAIRFGLVCRILGLNRFENCNLSDIARLSGTSRAAVSKIAISFRDSMGNPHLAAAGDREHNRAICKSAAIRAWEKRGKSDAVGGGAGGDNKGLLKTA